MEPTANDVASVDAFLNNQPQPVQPAPQPQPAAPQAPAPQPAAQPVPQPAAPQQQPAAPTPQPAPSSQPQDPFAMFAQPQAPAEPQQPTAQPTAQPTPQPQAPQQPAQAPAATHAPAAPASQEEEYLSFEQYMDSVTGGKPKDIPLPDASKINPDDEAGIKGFFDDLVNTAVQRATQDFNRKQSLQTSERKLWDDAFEKYGTLRSNKKLRDMVHNIRMGEFQRGVAITPTQAAEQLLSAFHVQYQRGVADNQVVTTIQDVQPMGGGGSPVETTVDKETVLKSLQTGGEDALANYLDGEIKAGRL